MIEYGCHGIRTEMKYTVNQWINNAVIFHNNSNASKTHSLSERNLWMKAFHMSIKMERGILQTCEEQLKQFKKRCRVSRLLINATLANFSSSNEFLAISLLTYLVKLLPYSLGLLRSLDIRLFLNMNIYSGTLESDEFVTNLKTFRTDIEVTGCFVSFPIVTRSSSDQLLLCKGTTSSSVSTIKI